MTRREQAGLSDSLALREMDGVVVVLDLVDVDHIVLLVVLQTEDVPGVLVELAALPGLADVLLRLVVGDVVHQAGPDGGRLGHDVRLDVLQLVADRPLLLRRRLRLLDVLLGRVAGLESGITWRRRE